jgi:outer membrane lipoprotein carrier protein
MKKPTVIFTAILSLACIAHSYAQSPDTRPAQSSTAPATRASIEMLNHVQDKLRTVNTVEADFVEEKQLAMLDHTLTIRGHFAMQKPDRLVWIVLEPVKYAVSIHGDIVRQWDQDTNNVQTINIGGDPTFKAVSEQLSSWFMGDYQALGQSYDVDVLSQKPLTFSFAPKGDSMVAKVLKQIVVTFAPDDRNIETMVVTEAGGSVTTINYINVKLNEPVKAETWEIPPHDR